MEDKKNTGWGAQKIEWDKFVSLGLIEDLLPVVSNPGAGISPNSRMKDLGKTPSLYNHKGDVVGLSKWTERKTTTVDVTAWMKEPDYGLCLQCRIVRGLDIDVADKAKSKAILQFIYDFLEHKLPLRARSNSGKCLLAFRLNGVMGKRILKVEGGIIEFLANGQQFIAAGQHKSGARYEWTWNGYEDFPVVNKELFEDLWFALCEQFGIAVATERGLRNAKGDRVEDDETSNFLEEKGFSLGRGDEGQVFFECPFSDEHTTESSISATAYFPPSRGYQQGHFKCLHAHCEGRTDNEFLVKLGKFEDEMEVITVTPEEKELELPKFQRDKHGKPFGTINNVQLAISRADICGSIPCYDVFRDEIIFFNEDRTTWQRATDEYYIQLRIRLEASYHFLPIGREMIRDAVLHVAERNKVDTAQNWLNSLKWDGVCRIHKFLPDYFGAADTAYSEAVSMYLWTGLAGRVLEPGLKADMVPIAKGKQGWKKSTVIEAIAPSPDEFCEIDFEEKDADLARKMRGILIAEISELRGMKTRAIESIKAFTSRRHEKWIPKYREFSVSFPRRLMFIATTNDDTFLADSTGNRRWLPFEVIHQADADKIRKDRDQLWAEARETFLLVGLCFEQAEKLATKEHEQFTMPDEWTDLVIDWLDREEMDGTTQRDKKHLRSIDIFREALNIDPRNIRKGEQMKLADVLKELGYIHERGYEGGTRVRGWVKSLKVDR